jgi:peptidyl-prolyl cis-trans isomerase C
MKAAMPRASLPRQLLSISILLVSVLVPVGTPRSVAAQAPGPEESRPTRIGPRLGVPPSPSQRAVDPTAAPARPVAPPAPRALTPEDEARRARIVARVGEARVTVGDVEDQIARQSPFMRARYRDPAALREFAQNLVRFELLAREAARRGYDRDPEVRRTAAQGAVQQLVRERFDNAITPETISQADVHAYYDAHPEEFNRPEMRRASHILLATRDEAAALLAQVREADARTFRLFAQERSLDAESRARGGDLRYFDDQGRGPNTADPAVASALVRAAFALREVGNVSDPVEIDGQWSIVKLTGMRPAEHQAIADAAPAIRMRLWREQRQGALDTFVSGLRERTPVEVHYERTAPIRIEPPAPASASAEDEDPASDEEHEHPHPHPRRPPSPR